MTEAEVIKTVREHLERQFPKVCATCERIYPTLGDYLRDTRHMGPIMPYDMEIGNWKPVKPVGTVSYSNCSCGSTLALSSHGISLLRHWSLLYWARIEIHKRGITPQELLQYVREEICKQVFAEPGFSPVPA